MDLDGYKQDFEGFYENFIYLISINKGRTIITKGSYAKFVETLFVLLFLS